MTGITLGSWLRSLALIGLLIGGVAAPAVAQPDDEAPAAPDDPTPAPAPADDDPTPAPAPADDDPTPAPAPAPADDDPTPTPAPAGDDPTPTPAPAADDADPTPTPGADVAPLATTDDDGDGTPDAVDSDDDNDGISDAAEDDAQDVAVQEDEDGQPYIEADSDGDGVVEADELAEELEFDTANADIPAEVDDDVLDQRPEDRELVPSLTVAEFRNLVRLAKRKVLPRMEAKIQQKSDARMATVSTLIFLFSLAGVLLLATPLVIGRKYPGQTGNLFKYSALAAGTFIVTVNLFGVIMVGMRKTQSALSSQTNPQLKIAGGFFDALDQHAPKYVVTGKELFAPTLRGLDGKSDEQPAAQLIENGQKIVQQASVFKRIAGWFKNVSFVFGVLPMVLLGVTLLLFILAIKPTLIEIIKLPATVAAGAVGAGKAVVQRALRRVGGELIATVCTLGVLVVITLLSGFVLGQVVSPALDALITCFARGVDYLQFVEDAATWRVFLMMFSVILFLVLNLAVVIVSMSFFLGKTQKIFQQRFNDGVPLRAHRRWFTWAIPSVLVAQLLPLLYVFISSWAVGAIERKVMASITDAEKVNWSLLMLATPLLLVVGFLIFFWAARGVKAIGFMAKYKVKLA